MAEFDLNKVKGNDRVIAGGAVLIFILTFLPWYTISTSVKGLPGRSASVNMWDAYGWNKVATFLALAAGAIVIARLMGALDSVQLPAGINLITLAISGLATLIFLLRLVTSFESQSFLGSKISGHPGIGWYLALLVSAAMTYFAFLNFKASGEQLPATSPDAPPPDAP